MSSLDDLKEKLKHCKGCPLCSHRTNLVFSDGNPNAKIICDDQRIRPEKSEVNRLLGCNEKLCA